jgi:hypothetical protein
VQPKSVSYSVCLFSLSLLCLWQGGSCEGGKTGAMAQQQQNCVANGVWGGQNAHLEVTEGGAQVRFTCAHGSIEEPLTLDAEGRFSANGTFVAEPVGPSRADEPTSRPVVYSGVVRDKSMTLTFTFKDNKEKGGTFNLTQGEPGSVRRCH